ncbi:MAG TPA: uracil-DNA glycosylase [Pyrinomonadaceae bacterium]
MNSKIDHMDSPELQDLINKTEKQLLHLQSLGVEGIQLTQAASPPPVMKPVNFNAATAASKPTPSTASANSATKSTLESLFVTRATEPERLKATGETFDDIHLDIGNCTRCPLHRDRTNICHTEGNRNARLMFVGEAPGADEDMQARPFVGRAGQLLTKIIEAIGLKREEVLIGNVNRCRPPGNRAPMPDEAAACKPFLLREIAAAQPEVIVVMGNTAMKNLLDTREGITRLRGIFQDYKGIRVMPTFHPAYLLRDPSKKRETWEDLKKVRDYLDSTAKNK